MRALVANMVTGVTKGFERKLEINGVGYRAEVAGQKLNMALGYSHPVVFELPKGIAAKVDKNIIILTGIDREVLGETAAKIRGFRPPEPYKGKGIKYVEEVIKRKVGKTGAAKGSHVTENVMAVRQSRRASARSARPRSARRVTGTAERPRLSGVPLREAHLRAGHRRHARKTSSPSASTLDEKIKGELAGLKKSERAKKVGAAIAKKLKEKGIDKVVFDRNGYIYHGRVKALADAAREAGLKF